MQELKPPNGIPIHLYVENLEQGAREQAELCAQLPHAFHHLALMPDSHQGYAMPVGGVMALKGAVMPNAVGVDIGCGMVAARTSILLQEVRGDLEKAAREVLYRIPVGFEWRKQPQEGETLDRIQAKGKSKRQLKERLPIAAERADEARYQLGTLGGGNHFIEFQTDDDGWLWVMLHSGSRNIGLQIANHYHNIAKHYCADQGLGLPRDYAFLPLELPEAGRYLAEMQWAMDFAMENRLRMLDDVFDVMRDVFGKPVKETLQVRTHHNYAAWEEHFGEMVLVHRKGAVRAAEGQLVTIPGSMGTASYIGCGKGFLDSYQSCSHGAGRLLGRKQAKKSISAADFQKQLKDVIVVTPKMNSIIDEAPAAYKNIEDVMRLQRDMVDVAFRLRPLVVVKG
ncbi:MAG: RtcB family protein [Candidatus Omnitrophica bacterium]|nr:RtcB family protein [Candidatus Omnitrophota bacterium]